MSVGDIADIISKGKGKMPAFPLAQADVQALARYVQSLNSTAAEGPAPGDPMAGERIFFGAGQCASCHIAEGRGSSLGPDLSDVGRRLTQEDLRQSSQTRRARRRRLRARRSP